MQLAVRWATLSVLLSGVPALRIINSSFPSHVVRNGSMNLTCNYDSNGERIYQVKWYKDDREFYRYVPERTAKTFNIPGVSVNVERSSSRSVLLESVDLSTEGTYGCEVTVEESFDTVIATGRVTVVELPQKAPVISGDLSDSMDEGDRVRVNCTAYRSRPAAQLTWYINGARSDGDILRLYPSIAAADGRRTATLGLDFRLRGSHFGPAGQLKLKCTAEIETVYYSSANIRIASRTMAVWPRFGSGPTYRPLPLLKLLVIIACYQLWLQAG